MYKKKIIFFAVIFTISIIYISLIDYVSYENRLFIYTMIVFCSFSINFMYIIKLKNISNTNIAYTLSLKNSSRIYLSKMKYIFLEVYFIVINMFFIDIPNIYSISLMIILLLLCSASINYYFSNFKNISPFDLYVQNLIIGGVLFTSIMGYIDSNYFNAYLYIVFNVISILILIIVLMKINNEKYFYGYDRKIIYDVSHPHIDVKNVVCKGNDDSHYIEDFSVESGVVFLKGDNGVGKSELLKIIGGFKSNVISYDVINTFGTSVIVSDWQNISYSQTERQFYDKVFKINGIDNDYTDYLDKCKILAEYSTGNFKYIKIVLAFLLEPQIIILDEPFENLDHSKVKSVEKLIHENRNDKLIIVTTHINDIDINPDYIIEFRKKND